jgi:drug/metabolite transporter (DMT)-like permease
MHSNSSATQRAANRRGALAMAAAMASFATNDALVKYVSQSLPASQLIFLRGVFATALLLAVAHAMGASPQIIRLRDGRVLQRALLDAVATVMYLVSLFHLPLANATAIGMAAPLFLTLFAVLAFGERVAAARWMAIAAGFSGVLLVVQPSGAAFNAYALLCLGGTLLNATRDLVTRTIARGIPSIVVTLSTAVAVTLLAGVWSLTQDWLPVSWQELTLLAVASVFLSAGYYLLTISMRSGEMSVIAPFRYAALLFAVVIGYAVWGDVPNALAWGGIALLVAAGLYVLHAQRMSART